MNHTKWRVLNTVLADLFSQAAEVPELLEECEDFRRPQLAFRPAATWDVGCGWLWRQGKIVDLPYGK